MSNPPVERVESELGFEVVIEKLRNLVPGKQGVVVVFSSEGETVVMARGISEEHVCEVLYDAIAIASERV